MNFFCLAIILVCMLPGCGAPSHEKEFCETSKLAQLPLLNLRVMPADEPKSLEKKFVWGLWKLDKRVVKSALEAGVKPYNLSLAVDVSKEILDRKQLSPYALLMEGYLARTNLEENNDNIRNALNQLYECIELLIEKKVSIDQGVLTFGSHETMRKFAQESLKRLNAQKYSSEVFDAEAEFALNLWERIQSLIERYQPQINDIKA